MRDHYDFSKGRPNPYAKLLRKSVTIRLDVFTIEYFKRMAEEVELPYQSLINLYLRDCAGHGRRLSMAWRPVKKTGIPTPPGMVRMVRDGNEKRPVPKRASRRTRGTASRKGKLQP